MPLAQVWQKHGSHYDNVIHCNADGIQKLFRQIPIDTHGGSLYAGQVSFCTYRAACVRICYNPGLHGINGTGRSCTGVIGVGRETQDPNIAFHE